MWGIFFNINEYGIFIRAEILLFWEIKYYEFSSEVKSRVNSLGYPILISISVYITEIASKNIIIGCYYSSLITNFVVDFLIPKISFFLINVFPVKILGCKTAYAPHIPSEIIILALIFLNSELSSSYSTIIACTIISSLFPSIIYFIPSELNAVYIVPFSNFYLFNFIFSSSLLSLYSHH